MKAAVTGARSPTESAGTVQLGLGGTFEGTNLFASEDLVMSFLTQRLGPPDDIFDRGMCEGGGSAGRRVTWGNLTVLFVDDGAAYLEAQHPRDERRRTDFGRWEYWLIKTGTDVQGMQTTEGVGIGPSLDDVTAAYPDAQVGEEYGGTYAEVFPGQWGVPTILDSDSLLRGSVHARAAAEVQSAVQG